MGLVLTVLGCSGSYPGPGGACSVGYQLWTARAVIDPPTAATDANLKPKIEAALKAKGFANVTVDTSAPKMVARGTVPKGKLMEAVAVIMEANGGKPVDNQITEK